MMDTNDRPQSPSASTSPVPAYARQSIVRPVTPLEPEDEDEKKEKKKKKKKDRKEKTGAGRGIETMFRTSYRTHIDMSGLADAKANIMITINGLIMSILLGAVSPGIDTNRYLLWPTSFLLVSCLVSMVFAILAARPRVSSNVITLDQVRNSAANILFFGNFVSLSEPDYIQGMHELLQDPNRLYTNMIKDIYSLGSVLQRKFKLLRTSYTIFMFGLIGGVILFIISFILVTPTPPPPVIVR
jgi:hypothetical protein